MTHENSLRVHRRAPACAALALLALATAALAFLHAPTVIGGTLSQSHIIDRIPRRLK